MDSDDSCEENLVDEQIQWLMLCGLAVKGHFHKVLNVILKLSRDIIRPNANYNVIVPEYILKFLDCIGAIDVTHVRASVRESEQAKYIGRKGYVTHNIMATCNFNTCFTFAWAKWEGTAHDTTIFNEARKRRELNFPHPIGAKQYVVDADIQIQEVILLPTKAHTSVIIFLIFGVDRLLSHVSLEASKRHKTSITRHFAMLSNKLLECGRLWEIRY